jgi:predicted alpha/beta superfamily hydrolase
VLCTGFFVLIQLLGNAQINKNQQFLKKIGIIDSLYSETLKEYRELYIQLPANYNPEKNKEYPVVYILDGEVLLSTVNNVQSFYSGGFTPEMVLVGVSNANNRTRDLTTSKITKKYGMPFNEENGKADNFTKFIEAELIPFIENKYPVTSFRTLIGHSYGGLFTIYILINHPHLFSNYLAIDPSLDWDNQKLLTEAQERLSSQNHKGKSLFMSLNGQLHMQNPKVTIENVMHDTSEFTLFARSNITFSNTVKQNNKNGLAYEWKFYPRDLHGTISFPSIMDGLIFDFEWYQMENTDKFNSPTTSKEELFSIVNHRAKKLEDYFGYSISPYPEDLFNALGYMSLDMEQSGKAKMFFDFAIEFYPNSPNTYDSMSEYYERISDYDNALKFATKAYEISHNDYHKQRMETLRKK